MTSEPNITDLRHAFEVISALMSAGSTYKGDLQTLFDCRRVLAAMIVDMEGNK